jgi:PAS domain S-box-containing protein
MVATGAMQSAEMEMNAFGGYYIVSCTPIRDAAGTITKVLQIGTDITERRNAEALLRASESRYRSIVENIDDALFIHDGEGLILDVNESACRQLGYVREELVGANLSMFDSIEDSDLIQSRMRQLYQQGSLVFEGVHLRKDGSPIAVLVSAKLVSPDGAGVIQGFARDVTHIKRMEENIRTAEKVEALGVLAGGIAHDFNNLLAGLYGFIDMAREASADPQVTEYLDIAWNTLERARTLTHQLLTFAKGGAPVRKTGDLVRTVREAAEFASSGSRAVCLFSFSDDLWACDYDASQIAQVVDNLVINARQAMPSGGTIRISAENCVVGPGDRRTLMEGRYVRVTVADSGVGIPNEIRDKIFDPFFTTKSTGSGLGLASCYSIIKQHGGHIDVHSTPGEGSAFSFFLPAADHPVSEKATASLCHARQEGRILIMDDDAVIRRAIRTMLERNGYTTVCVADGEEALREFVLAVEEAPFSAIILDLTIPGGAGGMEVIKEIRARDQGVPVFVISGYTETQVMTQPRKHGFTDSLRKPFTGEDLLAMLRAHSG